MSKSNKELAIDVAIAMLEHNNLPNGINLTGVCSIISNVHKTLEKLDD